MKYSYRKGFFWLLFYFVLALVPLLIAVAVTRPEYRGFALEVGVGLGFVGLGILGLQFLFSGRISQIAPSFGMDNILQYHREMGILAFLFILAHPVIIILADSDFLRYFDPGENLPRALALIFVTIALIVLTASSIWRLKFGLSYENWRLVHGVLSLGILFVGVSHSWQVAHYLDPLWKRIILVGIFAFYGYLVFHTRLVRPWLSRKKPWKVAKVNPERDNCWTLHLVPVGHKGMDFKCGQFIWITLGPNPFALQQHPFSITSACDQPEITITAKELGDFTATWKDIEPGTKAFLEGPFGSFTPVKGKNLFLVMGGIGITPAMSMLRTMQKQQDQRETILIYANPRWEEVTFREELEEIQQDIDLKVIHVLEEPPEGWEGEEGLVNTELLERNFPEKPGDFAFYICGPKPMQDAAELSLRDLGIDWRLIYSERFKII